MPDADAKDAKLPAFVDWCQKHITGDEKGQAQIYLDRLFQSFGHAGAYEAGTQTEFRVRKSHEDGTGTAFGDLPNAGAISFFSAAKKPALARIANRSTNYFCSNLIASRGAYVLLQSIHKQQSG